MVMKSDLHLWDTIDKVSFTREITVVTIYNNRPTASRRNKIRRSEKSQQCFILMMICLVSNHFHITTIEQLDN